MLDAIFVRHNPPVLNYRLLAMTWLIRSVLERENVTIIHGVVSRVQPSRSNPEQVPVTVISGGDPLRVMVMNTIARQLQRGDLAMMVCEVGMVGKADPRMIFEAVYVAVINAAVSF